MSATWKYIGKSAPVFHGAPPLLVADIELHNPTPERVHGGSLKALVRGDGKIFQVRVPGRIEPDSSAHLRARLNVDRATPPGTYHATVHIGEEDVPVELRVLARQLVQVSPSPVQLSGTSGDAITTSVFLNNRGNVAVDIPSAGAIFFEETDWLGRSLVFAMREAGSSENHHQFLDKVFREMKSTMAHTTSVKISTPVEVLEPSRSTEIGLSLSLPEGLHAGRRYTAFLDIAGARLVFTLECTGKPNAKPRRTR